jgi:hypothetical protein
LSQAWLLRQMTYQADHAGLLLVDGVVGVFEGVTAREGSAIYATS